MGNNQGRKKILIFSTAYLPLVGGAEIAVREITDRLPDWHFDLITARIKPGLASSERIGRVNVYRVGFGCGLDKFLLPIFGVLKAVKLDKKNDYSIIWSIMASQASVAASFFKLFSSKKLLLTLQEGDLESHLQRYVLGLGFLYKVLIKPWHLLVFHQADYATVISRSLRQRAIDNGVDLSSIVLVPNGVDINRFRKSSEEEIRQLKKELNIHNEKVIITASRLVYKNAVDDLIKAGRYLDFPFKILIVGSGEEEKKLRVLADDRVLFLGHIGHDRLPQYYSLADVFVRASRSEGFGNVFLEAMACGLPIIATLAGGIKDFLKDGQTGLVCEANNPRDIARQIKKAVSNDMGGIIRNGQELVRKKYTWETIGMQMEEVFLKL